MVALAVFGVVALPQLLPSKKPPGTHLRIQLDPSFQGGRSRDICQKSLDDSWLLRAERTTKVKGGMLSYLPRRIKIRCDNPVNAKLFDLSDVSSRELVALNIHPDARKPGNNPKPLEEYPQLTTSEGQKQVDWQFNRTFRTWGTCRYRLVVDCPTDPHALIDVWVEYGDKRFDESN